MENFSVCSTNAVLIHRGNGSVKASQQNCFKFDKASINYDALACKHKGILLKVTSRLNSIPLLGKWID